MEKKKLYIRKSATIFPIHDITLRYFDTTVMIFVVDTQQVWRYRSTDVSVDDKGTQNSVRTMSSECVNLINARNTSQSHRRHQVRREGLWEVPPYLIENFSQFFQRARRVTALLLMTVYFIPDMIS